MVVAPVPKPSPQGSPPAPSPSAPASAAQPTNIKDPKAWYRPGDSANTKRAIDQYVVTRNKGEGLANELRYITSVYGSGVADTIRQRASQMGQGFGGSVMPATPTAPKTATTALGEVVGDITAQDLLDANPGYVDLATAQQALNLAKTNPTSMAALRTTVVTAKNQFFLSLAGVTPSYADKRVQLAPSQPLTVTGGTGTGTLGNVLAAGAAGGAGDPNSTTFANALAAPRAAGYDVAGLQRRLNAAGILPDGTYTPGIYDPATIKAYSGVIQAASEMTIPISTRLDQMVANPTLQQAIAPQTRADPKQVTDYITSTFQRAAGRLPTSEEMAQYTSDYRMFEDKQYQGAVQQARGSTQAAGGTIYNYDPVKDVAAEIAQGQPAQSYVGQDWVGSINKILGK